MNSSLYFRPKTHFSNIILSRTSLSTYHFLAPIHYPESPHFRAGIACCFSCSTTRGPGSLNSSTPRLRPGTRHHAVGTLAWQGAEATHRATLEGDRRGDPALAPVCGPAEGPRAAAQSMGKGDDPFQRRRATCPGGEYGNTAVPVASGGEASRPIRCAIQRRCTCCRPVST